MTYFIKRATRQRAFRPHISLILQALTLAILLGTFAAIGTADAIDDNIHQKHRKMAIYQELDRMDREQGADETQIFVLKKISELLTPAADAGNGDDLRAVFTWLQDWHDTNRHPLYGLVLSEHFLTMLQSDLAIHDLQHEELVKKMLQNYFLAFVIIREEMARCAHPTQESGAGKSFVAFLLRYKLYKTLYNTLDDTQKRLIYKYVEKNEQKLHDRPLTDKYCIKPEEDAAEFLPQDEWNKKRTDLLQELKEAMGQ